MSAAGAGSGGALSAGAGGAASGGVGAVVSAAGASGGALFGGAGGVASEGAGGSSATKPLSSAVVLFSIPDILDDPSAITSVELAGEIVGSVTLPAQGGVALLYTNAIANDHLTILDLGPGSAYLSYRTVALKAPVLTVLPTADAEHAVAVLTPDASSSKPGAFALVPVAKNLPPKIQGTLAPVTSVALLPAPTTHALITVGNTQHRNWETHLATLPQLQIDSFSLPSAPLATGMVPNENVGYVAQEHPEGRMTFVSLPEHSARTLTGFELSAKVVEGN